MQAARHRVKRTWREVRNGPTADSGLAEIVQEIPPRNEQTPEALGALQHAEI